MSQKIYELNCILPQNALIYFEEVLQETASATLDCLIETGHNKGKRTFQAIFEQMPDREYLTRLMENASRMAGISLPEWTFNEMPNKNWLKESYLGFPPVVIGRYYIYGSHIQTPPPADKVALCIDAATAFGTGEHQTTHGCLNALDELDIVPDRVLDVGCGSGILAMAYAKTYHKPVDAVDIDEESVRVAIENAKRNGLKELVHVEQSNGYQKVHGTYDLIMCNILARPLREMAVDLVAHLNPNGRAILSGFLTRQKRWVLKAHTDLGLTQVAEYRIKGWSTLVLKR